MGYLSDSGHDIFISYAHKDNENPQTGDGGEGWVKAFDQTLRSRLKVLLGKEVDIWQDKRDLQGNVNFNEEIFERIDEVGVMVAVVSPSYKESAYCQDEINHFFEIHDKKSSLKVVGNEKRLVKVVKNFVPFDQHPEPLLEDNGFYFCEKEVGSMEYWPGQDYGSPFYQVLNDLANALTGRGVAFVLMTSLPQDDPLHVTAATIGPVLRKPFDDDALAKLIGGKVAP